MADTVQLNARVPREIAEGLDRLADLTGRKKVWHLNEALGPISRRRSSLSTLSSKVAPMPAPGRCVTSPPMPLS
jgi:predicted transcriptional regulator